MLYVFLSLAVVSLCAFLYTRVKFPGAVSLVLKISTSLLFIAVAITGILTQTLNNPALRYSIFFLCGFLLGLTGDILLDLKVMHPKDSDIYTFAGMAAFAVGHILFIYATLSYFSFNIWSLALTGGMSLLILLSTKLFKLKIGKFWIPVITYTVFLSFFASAAFFNLINHFSNFTLFVFLGALLFLLSDLVLSMTYFGGKSGKIYIISNHLLYYFGQYALAFSIMFLI